jgi:hypothetical protein
MTKINRKKNLAKIKMIQIIMQKLNMVQQKMVKSTMGI